MMGLVSIETIAPVSLASFTRRRREAKRPMAQRNENFDAEFDDDTLFFDAFGDGDGGEVVLIGPPLFNLEPFLRGMKIVAAPSGAECTHQITKLHHLIQIRVNAPRSTARLRVISALGEFDVSVSSSRTDHFAGRRVLLTLSKNNKLAWIQDWIRYHRDVHGADAVIIYDNGSTDYDPATLAGAIGALKGVKAATVVPWPFKYGPQGTAAPSSWDSQFCQSAALEHARRRFLANAASVLNGDIDELVVGPDRRGVFAAVETSWLGVLNYYGYWVYGASGKGLSLPHKDKVRHKDFIVTLKPAVQHNFFHNLRYKLFREHRNRCKRKWVVVPRRCPNASQWRVHDIANWFVGRLPSWRLSYRHFHNISTNWWYNRELSLEFDSNLHEVDTLLEANLRKVDWNA
jgi:hypothetical protein